MCFCFIFLRHKSLIPVSTVYSSECVGLATLCNIFGTVSLCCRLVQTMCILSFLSFLYFPFQFLRYGSLIVLTSLDRVASTCVMASCPPLYLSLYLSTSASADRGFTLGVFLRGESQPSCGPLVKTWQEECRRTLVLLNDNHDLYRNTQLLEIIVVVKSASK